MSNIGQFFGGAMLQPPKVIVNRTSAGGVSGDIIAGNAIKTGIKTTLSGALTANVLATVLSITGSGVVMWASCESVDATARTHRFKCTIDGVVAYDATTSSTGFAGHGIILIGASFAEAYATQILGREPFNASFLLEYASSLTETDKTAHCLQYRTN